MNKLLVFFLFCFAGCTILCMVVEGGGGFAATKLSSAISPDDTTINVISTKDFLDVDYIFIGDEKITYTGKGDTSFTGCTRGVDGTIATYHNSETKVYNEGSNILYNALGFNVSVSSDTLGTLMTLAKVVIRVVSNIPRVIAWDYSFLTGQLVIIKYFLLYPLSAGFIFALAMYFRQLIIIPFGR